MNAADDAAGAGGMDADQVMMEPIYVVFATKEDKLSKDSINKVIGFMHKYSEDNKDPHTQVLLNAILIVKGGTTPIAKKVSKVAFELNLIGTLVCRVVCAFRDRDVHAGRAPGQHNAP